MLPVEIWSGAQTGVDRATLEAAEALGLPAKALLQEVLAP